MAADAWNPSQYWRFAAERRQPFDDLLALVEPAAGGRVVDLGCGTGELTVEVHDRTGAARTLGFERQHVRLQVYGHLLASSTDVVEWTKGTSLTRFAELLDDVGHAELLARYRARVIAELGDVGPYFYAFKRILLWGRLPA